MSADILSREDRAWLEQEFRYNSAVLRYFERAPTLINVLRETLPLVRNVYPTEELELLQDSADWDETVQEDTAPCIYVKKFFPLTTGNANLMRTWLDSPSIEQETQRLWDMLGDEGYGRADFFFAIRPADQVAQVHFAPWYEEDFRGTVFDAQAGMSDEEREQAERAEKERLKATFMSRFEQMGYTVIDVSQDGPEPEAPGSPEIMKGENQ